MIKNTASKSRGETKSVQHSGRMVGWGSQRCYESEERGSREIYIESNYGRMGGVSSSSEGSREDGIGIEERERSNGNFSWKNMRRFRWRDETNAVAGRRYSRKPGKKQKTTG